MLSGWIGYLLTRTEEHASNAPFLAIGGGCGIIGGYVTHAIGLAGNGVQLDPTSLLTAVVTAAFGVTVAHFGTHKL